MEATEKLSVLDRHGAYNDQEYWIEVGTHITGILGPAKTLQFIEWMLKDQWGRAIPYTWSEQHRANLLLEFALRVESVG